MSYADSSRAQLLARIEGTYNENFVLGTTTHMQDVRITGHTLKAGKETTDNEEITGAAVIGRQDQVGTSVGGDIGGNLSYGTYDTFIAAALRNVDWTANALGVGSTPPTYAFQAGNLDIGTFEMLLGCYFGGMTLDISPKKAIGLSFAVMGARGLPEATATIDPTPVVKTTTAHMIAGAGIPSLLLGINGGSLAPHPGKVSSLKLTTDPGLRARPNVQSLASDIMGIGEFKVTVVLTGYMADGTIRNAYKNHQDVALSFITQDAAGTTSPNQYLWNIDRATITDHTSTPGSKNTDITNNYTIQGYGVNPLRIARQAAV